jgi:presequence protease
MVLETRSALESGVQGSGHSFAATRLDAQRSIAGWVAEQTGGLSYLESIRQLAKRVDDDWEGVQADLQSIRCGDQPGRVWHDSGRPVVLRGSSF